MDNKIYTTKAAAHRLNLSPTTLEAWRCRGGGPKFVKLGKAVRYCLEDLDEFLRSKTRTSTSQSGK